MVSSRLFAAPPSGSATASMTTRYLTALGLVALLSTAAFVSLWETISTQETAAAIVNFSGKRRYTSQRAALFASQLVQLDDPAARANARREMLSSIGTMESAHRGLIDGSVEYHLPGNPSPTIHGLYFAGDDPLDPLVRDYIRRVRELAAKPDHQLTAQDGDLAWILATAPGRLLDALDALVAAYQQESERDIRSLQELETGVFLLTLLVLSLEGLFIFRPMVRRVRDERARLQRAETYTRSILNSSYDGILTVDRNGDLASANPAVETMFGLPRTEILGRPFVQLIHPQGVAPAWSDPGTGVHTFQTRRRDGRLMTLDVSFSSMTLGDDHLVIAIMRESTEQLLRYARDLERRNQELDQFAYVASHDLKAPLRAIANLATWIGEDAGQSATPPTPPISPCCAAACAAWNP